MDFLLSDELHSRRREMIIISPRHHRIASDRNIGEPISYHVGFTVDMADVVVFEFTQVYFKVPNYALNGP